MNVPNRSPVISVPLRLRIISRSQSRDPSLLLSYVHPYSLNALLAGEDDAVETALWAAVRVLQENAELKERTASMFERSRQTSNAARTREDAKAQMQQAKLLRDRISAVQKPVVSTGIERTHQLPLFQVSGSGLGGRRLRHSHSGSGDDGAKPPREDRGQRMIKPRPQMRE